MCDTELMIWFMKNSIDTCLSGSCWVLLWSETVLPMGVGAVTRITGSGPFGPIGATSSASARRWINSFIKSSSSWELDESFFLFKSFFLIVPVIDRPHRCYWQVDVGDFILVTFLDVSDKISKLVTSFGCWCSTSTLKDRGCWWEKRP